MFTNQKSKKSGKSSPAKVFRWPLKDAKCQTRCLVVGAVILFALIFFNCANSPVKGNSATLSEESRGATVEEKLDVSFENGIMGGPVDMAGADIPAAQAAYGLIDSEATTTSGSAIYYESSGILSEDYPIPPNGNPFGGFRTDVTTYVVENSDTPFGIAAKFDINTDTILWANNLHDGDIIRPGDKLLILPINGVRVKVGAKDTLESLAKKYNGKVPEIQQFNNLESDKLVAGNYLIIPDGEPAVVPSQKPTKYTAPEYAKSTSPAIGWLIAPTAGYDWGILHYNDAVDIANVCGTPIYAAAAGEVIISDAIGWNGGYGKNIEIQHPNGVKTHYAHASQLLVNVGDEVGQGQLIALMGTTGHSTGCHLHFEVIGSKNPFVGRQNIGI